MKLKHLKHINELSEESDSEISRKETRGSNIVWEIEDYLDTYNVFLNGIRNTPAEMYSYNTVIDFDALKKAFDESTFTKEQWEEGIKDWHAHAYLSPIAELLAKTVERYLETK